MALVALALMARGASAQLATAPDANPIGVWRGTSVCVTRADTCADERIVYRITLKGAGDSLAIDARKMMDGREHHADSLACELNAPRAYITCAVADGKWRFRVRHDSLVGQFRLRDGTWFRDVHATRSRDVPRDDRFTTGLGDENGAARAR